MSLSASSIVPDLTLGCCLQIAVRGDDRALAIRGQLLLELRYLDIRRQSAVRHGLPDVERGCIKRAYLIRKLLDGPDGPLNDQVVSHQWACCIYIYTGRAYNECAAVPIIVAQTWWVVWAGTCLTGGSSMVYRGCQSPNKAAMVSGQDCRLLREY